MSLQLKRLGEIDRHSIFVRLSWLEGARVHLLIYSNCVALGMAGSRARIYPGESTIPQCGQDRPMLYQAASHHSGLLLTHPVAEGLSDSVLMARDCLIRLADMPCTKVGCVLVVIVSRGTISLPASSNQGSSS